MSSASNAVRVPRSRVGAPAPKSRNGNRKGGGKGNAGRLSKMLPASKRGYFNPYSRSLLPALPRHIAPKFIMGPTFFDARIRWPTCISPQPSAGNYAGLYLKQIGDIPVPAMPGTPASTDQVGLLMILSFSTQGASLLHAPVSHVMANEDISVEKFSQLASDYPLSVKPSRKTLSLTLTTSSDNTAGLFYVASVVQPLAWLNSGAKITAASLSELKDLAQSSPGSRQFSSKQMQDTLSFSLGFASVIGGSEWSTYNDTNIGGTGTPTDAATRASSDSYFTRMSSIVIYMPCAAQAQTLSWAVSEQLAARYPATHLLMGTSRRFVQVVPPAQNSAHVGVASVSRGPATKQTIGGSGWELGN